MKIKVYSMTKKTIPMRRKTYEQLKKCKLKETERNTHLLERLLDKYEKEMIENGKL